MLGVCKPFSGPSAATSIDVDKDVKPTEAKEVMDLRKRAGVPEIDPDALPSSTVTKMTACATKHIKKLSDLLDDFKSIEKPTDVQKRHPNSTKFRIEEPHV